MHKPDAENKSPHLSLKQSDVSCPGKPRFCCQTSCVLGCCVSEPFHICSHLALRRRHRLCVVRTPHTLRRQHNVELKLPYRLATRALVRWHLARELLERDEVDNKVVLDGKDGVGSEPWVVLRVDLGGHWLVLVVGDLRNDVSYVISVCYSVR